MHVRALGFWGAREDTESINQRAEAPRAACTQIKINSLQDEISSVIPTSWLPGGMYGAAKIALQITPSLD
jgi:hypothetical protein